jgi:hypothetical protein
MIVNNTRPWYARIMATTKRKATIEEDTQKFVLRLPENLHRALRHVAIDRGTSLNALINDVVAEWWSHQPERAGSVKPRRARRTG